MKEYRLSADNLSNEPKLNKFEFNTTQELRGSKEIIGQDDAIEAINFGLDINYQGYNIFIVNFSGHKELDYIKSLVKKKAENIKTPYDICYIYNFNDSSKPLALELPAGMGREFKEDMKKSIDKVTEDLCQLFDSEEYLAEKREIKGKYNRESSKILNEVKAKVADMGYILDKEQRGFAVIPLNEEENPMSQDEYDKLSKEEQDAIDIDTDNIQQMIDDAFTKIDKFNEKYKASLDDLDYEKGIKLINKVVDRLNEKYGLYQKISDYLLDIKDDILNSLDDFKDNGANEQPLLFLAESPEEEDVSKYEVNLLVDNSEVKGAPVILEGNPTYYNLMGRVEYSNKAGELRTDLTRIKGGTLHRANGGYLILEAKELLVNFQSWQLIKRVLKSKELKMQSIGEEFQRIPLSTLDPEAIEIDLKIIILGDIELYYLLYMYDQDFKELFKIKADFKLDMNNNDDNIAKILHFISNVCSENSLRSLNKAAVAKVIKYLSRKAGEQKKLSTRLSMVTDLLYEADKFAERSGKDIISDKEIEEVIRARIRRLSNYEEQLQGLYLEDKILMKTSGREVGQINGLSVLDLGEYSFGKPMKITATVYQGSNGIINIERDTKMSGKIHDKGLLILKSYLGSKYAQNVPLSLSASLCFEQLYSGIDGDSASSTELYALLSALSGVPIKQNLAVTGSINQKGEIQPIGGANEKIEGFFKICKDRGLNGEQGVIIPIQNCGDLNLDDEVIEAVRSGDFHIYAISHVEEGIEILTDNIAGKKNDKGEYPIGSINYLVQSRIEEMFKNSKE